MHRARSQLELAKWQGKWMDEWIAIVAEQNINFTRFHSFECTNESLLRTFPLFVLTVHTEISLMLCPSLCFATGKEILHSDGTTKTYQTKNCQSELSTLPGNYQCQH